MFVLSCVTAAPDRPGSLSIQVLPWIDMDGDSGDLPQLFWYPSRCLRAPAQQVCPCWRLAAAFDPLVWDLLVKTAPRCPNGTRRGETRLVGAGSEHGAVNPASTGEEQQFGS